MSPTDRKPLGDYFNEGLKARRDGLSLHDNPYSAGSAKRREWSAGFCATVETEDEEDFDFDPDDGPKRLPPAD